LRLDGWGLLAVPAIVCLGVFFAYPTIEILLRSVSEFASPQTSGLDNFRWFFDTPLNVTVLWRTFYTAMIVTAVCLAIAFPFAYLMTIARGKFRLLLLGIVLVTLVSSLVVRSYAWVILLQKSGPINDVLAAFGVGRVQLAGTTVGVVMAMSQILIPLMILPLYANMRAIDRHLVLAAESLGARPAVAFMRVYLPLSLPGMLAGSLFVFVLTLGFYITPTLVGSPQNALLSQLIVTQINRLLAFGRAGAMSVVLLLLALIVLGVVARTARSRLRLAQDQSGEATAIEELHKGGLSRIALYCFGGIAAVWMVLPSLVVIPMSFNAYTSLAFPPQALSLHWYSNLVSDPEWTNAVRHTLEIGIGTTVMATVLGTAAALALDRGRIPGRKLVDALFVAPMVVPLVIIAIGVYSAFLTWHLVGSSQAFLAAHTVLALPFVIFTVSASLRTFDTALERAAASLGAGPVQTFARITLPVISPGILAGAVMAFTVSFDESVVSLFLATGEYRTLPVQIYTAVIRNVDPTVAAASSSVLVLTILSVALGGWIVRRKRNVGFV
jgi:putative spermidine/putrescine transport system permease protein